MRAKIVSQRGKYKDDDTYKNIINYITQPNKCPTGFIFARNLNSFDPRNLNRDAIAEEMARLEKKFHKRKGCTKIRHIVITFEEKDNALTIEAALIANHICDFYADKYQVIAAVHEDTEHLHIHVVINTTNIHDGKKYTGRSKDYYDFQKYLRSIAHKYGMKFRMLKYDKTFEVVNPPELSL